MALEECFVILFLLLLLFHIAINEFLRICHCFTSRKIFYSIPCFHIQTQEVSWLAPTGSSTWNVQAWREGRLTLIEVLCVCSLLPCTVSLVAVNFLLPKFLGFWLHIQSQPLIFLCSWFKIPDSSDSWPTAPLILS